ncbi:MAG: hypothetical protein KAR54_02875 [Candidatus Pacebacteria bacterium]|nr:hypothetical protein [Candidatus Paceibacterota bacterium]
MSIKNIILGIFILIPTFCLGADELIIEQEVYNICNQNRLCEIDLGETVLTCPTDCFAGGGHPELIDQVLGGSITISDIKISIIADIITISWVTDKPSSSVLVLGDEIGNIEEFYLDELYSIDHSISLEDLNLKKEYFFKILSEGVYGDNNYDKAKLFVIKGYGSEETKEDIEIKTEAFDLVEEKFISSTKIDVFPSDFKYPMLVSKEISDTYYQNICNILSKYWLAFKNNIIVIYIYEYKWLLVILLGIIFLLFLIFKKKDNKKEENK